ncbi:dihydrofolate reductase-like domain-containing protein [Phyllosticta citricarpa]|uniref:Dihydrofolate reductase n=2 Tax=Phyllosticta TaxID=121621 RepID=A0ABR1MFS8_9PEZI
MPPPSTSRLPLTLIVATTPSLGIGKSGALPWPMLKREMAYFARVTKRVPSSSTTSTPKISSSPHTRNAVIMGRKTWDSIPPRFRPLKDRLNVVISRSPASSIAGIADAAAKGDTVVTASSLSAALEKLDALSADLSAKEDSNDAAAEQTLVGGEPLSGLGRVFVIGGAALYKMALETPNARTVLLTRIQRDWECDTFFPVDVQSEGWTRKSNAELSRFVGEQVPQGFVREVIKAKEEGGEDEVVEFEFCLFERVGEW